MEGKSVLFISVPNLIIELKEAMSRSQLTAYKRKFEKYDLVILDELGYVSFDKEGNVLLNGEKYSGEWTTSAGDLDGSKGVKTEDFKKSIVSILREK